MQLELDFNRPITPVSGGGGDLADQFQQFHQANPHVFTALRALALQLKRRGLRKYGMKGLFEVLRWQHAMYTDDPASDFKLNNNYTSFYARLLMEREPELDGFFEVRAQTWRVS